MHQRNFAKSQVMKFPPKTGVNISTYFLDQDRERFWILGVLGKGFLWHKWKFVNSLILLMHFICKKGKNLEIHPSFGYSWANYEKNKENFGKKCLVLPFWLGKSFWWCRERFHFLSQYIYPWILKPELPIYIVNSWRSSHFLAVVTSLAT